MASDEKIVLITGAAKGIGFAAAEQLASRGAKIIIGTRDESKARAAAERIGCDWMAIDIDSDESVARAAEAFGTRYDRLDVLVNNAAILLDHYGSLLDLDAGTLGRTLNTNVVGAFRVIKAFAPFLKKSDGARILNVSSGAGQMEGEPQPWAPAYSVSKAGLNMLTQQATAAMPEVAVNSMCPGWCRTEMGGEGAPLTAEQGADTLVWLAMDAPRTLRGRFVKERREIPW